MQSAVSKIQASWQRLLSGKAKIVNAAAGNEKCLSHRVWIQSPDGLCLCARLSWAAIIIPGFGFACNPFYSVNI